MADGPAGVAWNPGQSVAPSQPAAMRETAASRPPFAGRSIGRALPIGRAWPAGEYWFLAEFVSRVSTARSGRPIRVAAMAMVGKSQPRSCSSPSLRGRRAASLPSWRYYKQQDFTAPETSTSAAGPDSYSYSRSPHSHDQRGAEPIEKKICEPLGGRIAPAGPAREAVSLIAR
ncbi:hypothetical protein [Frankia sp. CIT1]|uniref:hypothetical protein n=3 Tax=Frankia TaxID=1854 RepID=UPI001EF5C5FF|nr:hypothetical protein [Frankia sp. CIT1]